MTAQLRSEGSSPSSLVGSGSGPLGAYAGRKHGRLPGDESSAPVVGAPEVFMGSLESLSDVLGGRRAGHTLAPLLDITGGGWLRW